MANTSRHPRRLRRLLLLLPAAALSDTDASCIDSGDLADHCPLWAQRGECATNPVYMHEHCRRSCGCPAQGPPPPSGECADRDKSGACATWAAAGECDANPAYMKVKCASTCGTCDMLDWRKRCPVDPEAKPAVPPGAMQETFERALSNFPQYSPQLLSSDPYVVTFEERARTRKSRLQAAPAPRDFISDDEVEALLRHSEGRFVRSTASGGFTVQPKKGRAVLWPATFNERPFEKDARTHHEALPANFWLHQYDYVDAHHRGCTA
ncbi:hypothetical protein EMIHUDRAFT_228956 [Emiliania huxleyi CCMP1516]|uniref:ShKT domain-containing protein n=2 Tax=Emiliania huxleyi TaxID=2903 RepID=A0A0D3KE96_EMIH1|nr:hypothetical protein EMIHUDRAFT_228956 [Emiliania huxleyi CCMP1516]EOD34081.1 hypothetical protein EMIHUDRAFT_228956 [Emiliania huxleyi CCMP1516]|eukprot:XP_005786510.1 hypothetical protein EMIHUDRAFT_228956 [Emiliania huxleyi CCMP1516]